MPPWTRAHSMTASCGSQLHFTSTADACDCDRDRPYHRAVMKVEDLVAEAERLAGDRQAFDLWVPDAVQLNGQPVPSAVAMAVIGDKVLSVEFEPDGFSEGVGGRMYRFKPWH